MGKASSGSSLLEVILTVAVPAVILSKLSAETWLGPENAFYVALVFPIGFFLYRLIKDRTFSLISGLGLISVLMTGGLGLLKVGGFWFAVKESTVSAVIGTAILVSLKTRSPLVKTLLYNDKVIQTAVVQQALEKNSTQREFERLLVSTSYILAASFFLSAVLHFVLTTWVLTSPAGTVAFNEELGKLKLLNYPFIAIPNVIITGFTLFRVVKILKKITGLKLEEIMKT